jgi:hypothetical protein
LSSFYPQALGLWITHYPKRLTLSHDSDMSHSELLPIPHIETATDPVHSAADLRQRWRALMEPLGFGQRLLRFAFIGPDRRLIKVLTDIEIGPHPELPVAENIMSALQTLLGGMEEGTTVAFLLSRPGRGPVSNGDRRWSTWLTESAKRFNLPIEPIFRANDESLLRVDPAA